MARLERSHRGLRSWEFHIRARVALFGLSALTARVLSRHLSEEACARACVAANGFGPVW